MAGVYLDTSAVGRLLLAEHDAPAIRASLAEFDGHWSSELLIVELRRLAAREDLAGPAVEFIESIELLAVDSGSLNRASRLPPEVVRSLDAIHLEAALALRDRGAIEAMLTYDRQLQVGCEHHGLRLALSPR